MSPVGQSYDHLYHYQIINASIDLMFNVSQVVWPLAHNFTEQGLSLDLFPKKLCLYGNNAHCFQGMGVGWDVEK